MFSLCCAVCNAIHTKACTQTRYTKTRRCARDTRITNTPTHTRDTRDGSGGDFPRVDAVVAVSLRLDRRMSGTELFNWPPSTSSFIHTRRAAFRDFLGLVFGEDDVDGDDEDDDDGDGTKHVDRCCGSHVILRIRNIGYSSLFCLLSFGHVFELCGWALFVD